MSFWSVEQDWKGQTAVIVAGGPSIKRLGQIPLLQKMRGRFPVIAVSNAYQIVPWADILIWTDQSWLEKHWRNLHCHTGIKVSCRYPQITSINEQEEARPNWFWNIRQMQFVSDENVDIELDNRKLRGRSSAHQAINLAYHLGCRRIIGVGYDMRTEEPDGFNWYDQSQDTLRLTSKPDTFSKLYLPDMEALPPVLKKLGVQFYNANPESAIRCFPFVHLEEAIRTWT